MSVLPTVFIVIGFSLLLVTESDDELDAAHDIAIGRTAALAWADLNRNIPRTESELRLMSEEWTFGDTCHCVSASACKRGLLVTSAQCVGTCATSERQ